MKKLIKHAFSIIYVALCILIILAGCRKNPEETKGPVEKITFACAVHSGSVLVQIADKKSFFTAEGIAATLQPHASGKMALDAVLQGKADLATVAETPIMFAILKGEKFYTIAVIQTSNKNEAIVARKDRGITKPADLKGKKIGVTLGTTGDYFLDSFLMAQGIGRKTAQVIDMTPDEMPAAIVSGKVDAVSTWNPNLQLIVKALANRGSIFYGETLYTEFFCVAAGRDFIKKHPETIKKVLRALIKSEEFVKQHPEESRRLVAEFIKTDQALVDEIWTAFDFKVFLDQSFLVALEEETRWALGNKFTRGANMPNYLDSIYFDGLQSVKPEAVTAIR